jgi:hypothetical protein
LRRQMVIVRVAIVQMERMMMGTHGP